MCCCVVLGRMWSSTCGDLTAREVSKSHQSTVCSHSICDHISIQDLHSASDLWSSDHPTPGSVRGSRLTPSVPLGDECVHRSFAVAVIPIPASCGVRCSASPQAAARALPARCSEEDRGDAPIELTLFGPVTASPRRCQGQTWRTGEGARLEK